MAKRENTGKRDNLPSKWHRKLGKRIYGADVDFVEYAHNDKEIGLAAIVDYKHGSAESVSLSHSAMRMRSYLAARLDLPFFIVLSYLHKRKVPCYYVIAANDQADAAFRGFGIRKSRLWMSVKQFSKFRHHLRGLTWDGEEKDDSGEPLEALPDQIKEYPLPQFDGL